MKNPLEVLEACCDQRSGKRFRAGDVFDPAPTIAQAKRLVAAGCLDEAAIDAAAKAETDAAAIARDQINNDDLFDKTVDQLKEVAKAETIDLGSATKKEDIIAAIRAARSGK